MFYERVRSIKTAVAVTKWNLRCRRSCYKLALAY